MSNCVIIGSQSIGKTALIHAMSERLREKGCEVIVVDELPQKRKRELTLEMVDICFAEIFAIHKPIGEISAGFEFKTDWKRERHYPTLKEGIRRNQIRRLKK